jgi:putative chitinase
MEIHMNRKAFFDAVRGSLFGGSLTTEQVDNLGFILDEWERQGGGFRKALAYVLATPYWEVGRAFVPIRENLNYTTAARIRAVWPSRFKTNADADPYVRNPEKLANKVYSNRLGNGDEKSGDGFKYRGAGIGAQITGKVNYARFGIAEDPAKAMDAKFGAYILVRGMKHGMFTGKSLDDYFDGGPADYVNARRIINADVKANGAKIAAIAAKFDVALEAAGYGIGAQTPVDAPKPSPAPTTPDKAPSLLSVLLSLILSLFKRN